MLEQLDNVNLFDQEVPVQEEQAPVEESPRQETQKEINHRILRERAEAAERRAAELEYQLKMSERKEVKPQVQDEEDDLFDISDDAYVEGHQVKKYLKKINQRVNQATKKIEEEARNAYINSAESNLKREFSDFDKVVTKENLDKLQRNKGPLFRSIMANPDLYDRGYSAYEAIKNMIPVNEYEEVDRKIESNRQRPRSAAGVSPQTGDTPLSRVGDYDRRILTPERREQILRQVEEAKRNRI